jgi:hypothetical protein
MCLAIPSQRLWRGRLARQKFQILLEKHRLHVLEWRMKAATKMQSQLRGKLARQTFATILMEHRR